MRRLPTEALNRLLGSRLEYFGQNIFTQKSVSSEKLPLVEIPPHSKQTLYIHIPFCHAPLCEMCPFFRMEYQSDLADRYLLDLEEELKRYQHLPFPEVYVGGGTPATVLKKLVALLKKYNLGSQKLSLEAHPQDLTADNIRLMEEAGVTRLSVGIQSFNPQLLEQMDRNNGRRPIENLKQAVDKFTVNADLIYNFAGQTVEQFLADLDTLIAIGVPQITCYPLMAAPGSFKIVDNSQEREFYFAMLAKFKEHGYQAKTPWCFTKDPDTQQGEYISEEGGEEYLGVGASAISKIGETFIINLFNLDQYHQQVNAGMPPLVGARKLSLIEDAQYFLLTGLFGMRLDTTKLTGNPVKDKLIKMELFALRKMGLVTIDDHTAELTPEGMFFFSRAMKDFYTGLNFFRQEYKEAAQTR